MLARAGRTLARGAAGTVVLGGGATVAYAYVDTGFGRQCEFWRTVVPAAVQYATCAVRHRKSDPETKSAEYKRLHDKWAPISLDLILSLRGLYVKFGQAAASSPFVPQAYRSAFKALQSDVPSEDSAQIKKVIEAELGPIDTIFAHFSETSCGAASIGQAHVATLHTGERVVVKIQYPDARRVFAADATCLRALVKLAQPEALPAFSEFESQLALELDYRKELANLRALHEAVMPRYGNRVAIPVALPALCSERVLTMQHLPGPKLEGEMRRQMAALGMRIDENESMRDWLVRLDAEQQEEAASFGRSGGDEGEGGKRSLWVRAARLVGLDLSLWLVNKARDALAIGGGGGHVSRRASEEAMRARLSALVEVHGYEMFDGGLFNADPHPGNLIAMDDGRVGLIDYGQCKRLDDGPRRAIAELMVKVAEDAPPAEVAAAFRRVGVLTEHGGDEFLAKLARLMFGRISGEMLEREWHKQLHKSDRVTHFPPDLLMVHRVALILRGLSVAVRQNISVAELWRPHALVALQREPKP